MSSHIKKLDQRGAGLISTLISVLFGVIISLVALRLIFLLFNANSANVFVSWVYDMTASLVAPFANIFPELNLFDGRLEMQALVALLVYSLIAGVINWLLRGSQRHAPTY